MLVAKVYFDEKKIILDWDILLTLNYTMQRCKMPKITDRIKKRKNKYDGVFYDWKNGDMKSGFNTYDFLIKIFWIQFELISWLPVILKMKKY